MDTLTVGLDERSYLIHFGAGIIRRVGEFCHSKGLGRHAAVVTNPTVGELYFSLVESSLCGAGFTVCRVDIPDGEQYKNSETLNSIYDALLRKGLTRDAFIVALGGGVVGDIAGFAAATFLRGIRFVQVPTTLLAQVDSSVGGKTGINHPLGKNLIGAFYQPAAVVIDVDTLITLPEREYLGGLAEVVKYGVVLDADFFGYLRDNTALILSRDPACLLEIVHRSCAIKASIVEKDECESGVRAVLNYGHTLGHAVETLTGYRQYIHGEAVSIGMAQAARISAELGYSSREVTEQVVDLLRALQLPVELPGFSQNDYIEILLKDKKVRDNGLNFVFNKGLGSFTINRVKDVSRILTICGIEE